MVEFSDPNPWHPITDPVSLKHLGKLGEELGELMSAKDRVLIQGIDGLDPITSKPNRQWLEEEVADVLAGIDLLIEHFDLDVDFIQERSIKKFRQLRKWHLMA